MIWWQKLMLVLVCVSPGILFAVIIIIGRHWEWLVQDYPYDDKM